MSIPLATTTITVLRSTGDPYETQTTEPVASGVRAVIGRPRGDETPTGGSQEVAEFRLNCDPVDLEHTDQVRDDQTSEVYEVVWAMPERSGPGGSFAHTVAGLKRVTGIISRPSIRSAGVV